MNKYKEYFKLSCRILSIGWAGTETAFFHGINTGNFMAIVDINSFGEAYPEMVFWIILTPVVIYGSYLNIIPIFADYDKVAFEKYSKKG